MQEWIFKDHKIIHKCKALVVRPKGWYKDYPLYCSRCNIPMPYDLQNIAEFVYDEWAFHDPNIFYSGLS